MKTLDLARYFANVDLEYQRRYRSALTPGILFWYHVIAICLGLMLGLSLRADTPAAIAADYRAKAKTALERVNTTLEKATVPIIAELVKAGDTMGADEVKAQLKAKQDGEPVAKPHAKAANLFVLYDAARLRALEPIQQATIRKLDAVLAGADGKKLEVVDAVKTVRAEIEAGKVEDFGPTGIPVEWTYHQTPDSKSDAQIKLKPDGVFEIDDGQGVQTGSWKCNKKGSMLTINLAQNTWSVTVKDGLGVIQREVGTRYMRPVTNK